MARTKMNNATRLVFGSGKAGGHALVPEILEVGWGCFLSADRGHLPRHTHDRAFELCLIDSGEVEWMTGHGAQVLRAGDLYLTQPGEPHWGRDDAMHPCTLYWLILGSHGRGIEWRGVDPEIARLLDESLHAIHLHRLHGMQHVEGAFRCILDEHKAVGPPHDGLLRRASARAALHRLLIDLIRAHERQTAHGSDSIPPGVVRAVRLLQQHPQDSHILHRVCQISAMRYRTLNQLFQDHLGLTVSQFRLRERIRLARRQLGEGDLTITNIATELGFSSSQHFATTFRRVTGYTPSEYRARHSPHQ